MFTEVQSRRESKILRADVKIMIRLTPKNILKKDAHHLFNKQMTKYM